MRLLFPSGLWFLSFVPILIVMYILKQKFEEREVSSTFLWEQVLKDVEVSTPWQRLKKSLLFFLQIFCILLLILAISNPFWFSKGMYYDNVIILIDNSGSMNGLMDNEGKGTTKLEEAKVRAEKLIDKLPYGSKINVISSGRLSKVEVNNTTDRKEAISKIKAIKPSNSAGDINEAMSLIKSISKQYSSCKAYIFTDGKVDLKDVNGEVINLVSERANVSLDYISYSKSGEDLSIMVRITNRSSEKLRREVSLYADKKLNNVQAVELKPLETKTIYFTEVPSKVSYIWAELTEKDGLAEDNIIYGIVKQNDIQKVLLVTEKNVFLEKALNSIKSIDLYKTNSVENMQGEFSLYIFDGAVPKEFPSKGSILLINPPNENSLISVKGEIEGGTGKVEKHLVTTYMENAYFTISKLKDIQVPYWAASIIKVGDKSAAVVGEYKGNKVCILGFDLHESDFPLTAEFPIFIHNITSYLVDKELMSKTSFLCGNPIDISIQPDAVEAHITLPEGQKQNISLQGAAKSFDGTRTQGIYELNQKTKDKEYKSIFAVNFPVSESESYVNSKDVKNIDANKEFNKTGINIRPYLIILLLMLLLTEWFVYIFKRY